MIKFKKGLSTKIISFLIAVIFVLNNTAYGIETPTRSHLRVPVGEDITYKRMWQVMYDTHETAIDSVIEKYGKEDRTVDLAGLPELETAFKTAIEACDASEMFKRLSHVLTVTKGRIQVIFIDNEEKLPVFEGKRVWGHAGTYITVFALKDEDVTETGKRRIIGRIFHEIRARSARAREIFNETGWNDLSEAEALSKAKTLLKEFEEVNEQIQQEIQENKTILTQILKEEFASLVFENKVSVELRDYAATLTRRDFLKLTAVTTGAVVGVAAVSGGWLKTFLNLPIPTIPSVTWGSIKPLLGTTEVHLSFIAREMARRKVAKSEPVQYKTTRLRNPIILPEDTLQVMQGEFGITSIRYSKRYIYTPGLFPCIAVVIWDERAHAGAIAHFDVPWKIYEDIHMIVQELNKRGVEIGRNLKVNIIGGTKGSGAIYFEIHEALKDLNVTIVEEDVGTIVGRETASRTILLDTETGEIFDAVSKIDFVNALLGLSIPEEERRNLHFKIWSAFDRHGSFASFEELSQAAIIDKITFNSILKQLYEKGTISSIEALNNLKGLNRNRKDIKISL